MLFHRVEDVPLPGDLAQLLEGRSRRNDESTGSEFCIELAQWWLKTCKESHPLCSMQQPRLPLLQDQVPHRRYHAPWRKHHPSMRQSRLPSRVLDVGPPDGSQDPILFESNSTQLDYVTLSYCWGDSAPFKTTKANIEEQKARICLKEMPKTFQDAISLARAFNVRYL
jgi:hypothetical protein